MIVILLSVSAYFIGAISPGYIFGRLVKGIDIRTVGNRNTGATNTFHAVGPVFGVLAGIFDFFKIAAFYFMSVSGLPFLFGASAEKLKRRYWIRAVAPPPGVQNQIWLEAYPRYQQDAADFQRADIVLDAKNVLPLGIQLHLPNGETRTSYSFYGMIVNDPNPLRFLEGDPFSPRAPLGWTRVVKEPPAAIVSPPHVGRPSAVSSALISHTRRSPEAVKPALPSSLKFFA